MSQILQEHHLEVDSGLRTKRAHQALDLAVFKEQNKGNLKNHIEPINYTTSIVELLYDGHLSARPLALVGR